MSDWRELLQTSRPVWWVTSALPFVAAALAVERGVTLSILLGAVYFLGPYNLLLHGTDDLAGQPAAQANRTRAAIAVTNLPLLVILVFLAGAAAGVGLLLAVAAALAYSVPPIRTRDRPIADIVTRAMHIVLPAACGFLVAGLGPADLPWLALVAFTAWAIASNALWVIHDLVDDVAGGRASTATLLGRRWTALVALAGYAIAAALAATHGPLGALAALGLDLFLLLPAMILLGRAPEAGAPDASAERAWAGLIGLNWLVGLWLFLLLLRHWRVPGLTAWEIAIGAAAAAIGYAFANVLATRVVTRRRRVRRDDAGDDVASLTIIVPCRDEADALAFCLASLAEQTYADATILVVDDGSTDGTAEVAAELLGGAGRVLVAPEVPEGWTGKAWACQVGANAATGDLILFVDADTALVPVSVRILVEQLEARRLDLLSGLTRDDLPTRTERAGVPGFALLLFGFVPIWLRTVTRGRLTNTAFAYGPVMLARRDAYVETGGHGASPGTLRDDIDLAETFARAGRRVGTVHAADLGMTRRDPVTDPVIGAWRRTFLPYAGGSLALAIATMLVETLAYLVPFVLPPIAWLTGAGIRILVASFVPICILGAMRFALMLTHRQPVTTVLWHPVTVGLMLIGQLAGIVDHVIGRAPRWRGRVVEVVARPDPGPPVA